MSFPSDSRTNRRLTKSDYKNYLICPEELWLSKHKPELMPPFDENRAFSVEQGNLVDKFVEELFADADFQKQFKLKGKEVRFQQKMTALPSVPQDTEGGYFLCISDVTVFDPIENCYDIYEVKASKEVKSEYIDDLAFQRMVFELSGHRVRKTYLVHISPSYVFQEKIDPKAFFRLPNVSDKVEKIISKTYKEAQIALKLILSPEPEAHFKLCGNKLDCVWLHYKFEVPEYSVFNIARLRPERISELLAQNIRDIADVPNDFKLSENQRRQVTIAKNRRIEIDKKALLKEQKQWQAPFYFLDYESINLVFPPHSGMKPYDQKVFQYSLHKLKSIDDPQPEHFEYIADALTESPALLVADLVKNLKNDGGTVFVWNASFEKTRNKEMGLWHPEFAESLADINARIYDLEIPFRAGMYAHPDFKGRSSIKKVLPVLVPQLNYNDLAIQNGGMAFSTWHKLVTDTKLNTEKRTQIRTDLLEYCKLDTWAMVCIWLKINEILQ